MPHKNEAKWAGCNQVGKACGRGTRNGVTHSSYFAILLFEYNPGLLERFVERLSEPFQQYSWLHDFEAFPPRHGHYIYYSTPALRLPYIFHIFLCLLIQISSGNLMLQVSLQLDQNRWKYHIGKTPIKASSMGTPLHQFFFHKKVPPFDRRLRHKLHESKFGDFRYEMDVYCCKDSATSLVSLDGLVSANHPSNSVLYDISRCIFSTRIQW